MMLCASFVEIGPVVLEKKIFKICPLGKGRGPSFEQYWIPFTQEWFMLILVESGPVVLEKKIFKSRQCIFAIL